MKKWWILGASILVVLLILGSYIYVRVGYKKPIFAIEYKSNKVYNGERYDGILFSTFYCKDGSKKVTSRFTNFTCSTNRNFVDGVYVNDLNVEIDEEFYYHYFLTEVYSWGEDFDLWDIDTVSQSRYDLLIEIRDSLEDFLAGFVQWTDDSSDEGFPLVLYDNGVYHCYLGAIDDYPSIYVDYVDGKCMIPEDIADYLKDDSISLIPPLKDKITCEINR